MFLFLILFQPQRKPNNPSGNKKGGAAKKDGKSGGGDGASGDGKTGGESSTDLATAAGGLSLEEQPKAD